MAEPPYDTEQPPPPLTIDLMELLQAVERVVAAIPSPVLHRVVARPLDVEAATRRIEVLLEEREQIGWLDALGPRPTIVQVLSTLLAGTVPTMLAPGNGSKNQFAAYHIEAFTHLERFKDTMDEMLRTLRTAAPAPGQERVFYPGLLEAEEVEHRRAHGIPLHRFVHVPRPTDVWGGLYVTVPPDVHIGDGDIIHVGDFRIEVVWTPGHAPGHCVMYLRQQRVMIVGDHLLPKITPHVGFAPGSTGNPLADFLDSQQKIQRFDVDLVLPAHGGVFPDHRHRANQIIQHHRVRLQDMIDIARREPHTAYDIARRAFSFDSDSPLTYQFPATFETLAHLEYLRQAGDLVAEERDEKVFWRTARAV